MTSCRLSARRLKAQSAMEYLMTYGWAILIIAVVLVALYSLGVFNPANFAPKAQPGACQVSRTAAGTNLEGQCLNVVPEFVAQFNGQSSYVNLGNPASMNFLAATNAISVGAWVYPTNYIGYSSNQWYITSKLNYPDGGWWFYLNNGGDVQFRSCSAGTCTGVWSASAIPLNQWSYVSATSDGNTIKVYINGALSQSGPSGSLTDSNAALQIDVNWTGGMFQGSISNVQVYNTTLSTNQIKAQYQEGIGGAPIDLQHLAGWWPLNGNAQDYSASGNNGAATGVSYTSAWTSGYSAP